MFMFRPVTKARAALLHCCLFLSWNFAIGKKLKDSKNRAHFCHSLNLNLKKVKRGGQGNEMPFAGFGEFFGGQHKLSVSRDLWGPQVGAWLCISSHQNNDTLCECFARAWRCPKHLAFITSLNLHKIIFGRYYESPRFTDENTEAHKDQQFAQDPAASKWQSQDLAGSHWFQWPAHILRHYALELLVGSCSFFFFP